MNPVNEASARLARLSMRAGESGVRVTMPRDSDSGMWEARGGGWTVTEADPSAFADELESRLNEQDQRRVTSRDVRQWQYEHGERALPEAPWWLGNWSAAGLVTRLLKRRRNRLDDARRRMQAERP